MQCDWINKVLTFIDQRRKVRLQGDARQMQEVQQVSVMQTCSWKMGEGR
jgi:hypothetical protein